MSLYGENQMYNLYNIPIPRSNYTDMCTCSTKYVYTNIIKCNNCIKCEKCKAIRYEQLEAKANER